MNSVITKNTMTLSSKSKYFNPFNWLLQFVLFVFITCTVTHAVAEDTFCAQVVIEIKQELTLERQGFDAHMRINNGADGFPVENVRVDVKFSDENGDPVIASSDSQSTDASFFITQDSLSGIDNVTGTGIVQPGTSADINWLIIPAPGSAGAISSGKLYFVGATLQYTLNGEDKVVEVSPDFIYVKPMPLLTLDYFLPKDVYGDDAFTSEIEPPVPFTLGVRVSNNGNGVASNLKINSSQPRIIENELGLLIGFRINSGYVDNEAVKPSLLLDFGEIPGTSAKMGRWQMETTLSGEFIEFTAEFSHADELGGELTSLMEAVNTHQLVHDVLVDLPGRDSVKDFLANDGGILRVYESNTIDTDVTNQSSLSSISGPIQQGTQQIYQLTMPATDGFVYTEISDPHAGYKDIIKVLRQDGKVLKKDNFWLSKRRRADNGWDYFLNIFDQNSNGQYTLVMDELPNVSQKPVLHFIPDRSVSEGKQIGFIVEARDPDGTIPALSTQNLPDGASFADRGDGVGIFSWTPDYTQAGTYSISYVASDGVNSATREAKITVLDSQVIHSNYSVIFESGFNLFTYPVRVSLQHETCLGFLNSIGDASVIDSISRYDGDTQQLQKCQYGSGDDFEINAGDSLVIQMLARASLTFEGENVCPVWFIKAGANYLGHPTPAADLSCYSLIDSIPDSVTSIQSFNSLTGRFESCFKDSQSQQAAGIDFSITATGGLIVNSNKQMLFTLPGCL